MQTAIKPQTFCGRNFSTEDLLMIQEVVTTCGSISRYELAHTICELLEWTRPGGGLKARECKDLLESLEEKKVLELPEKRKTGYIGSQKFKEEVQKEAPYSGLTGSVEEYTPLDVSSFQARRGG